MIHSSQPTLVSQNPYLLLKNQTETLKFDLTQDQHQLGRDPQRVDLVVPQNWVVLSGCHSTLRRVGIDYTIYDGDGVQAPSTNGLFINHTRITCSQGYPLVTGTEIKIGQNPKNQVLLIYINPNRIVTGSPVRQSGISLKNRQVLLGRDANADLNLDSPIVSRHHATITPDGQGRYLLKDHSVNGVFVNEQRVKDSLKLPDDCTLKIGPFTLMRRGDHLQVLDQGNQIRLDADRLFRSVHSGNIVSRMTQKAKPQILLRDISFAIEPGQFVALVGGSGAGKSTLMRTLLGIDPTNRGKVFLNGDDLRRHFNLYRSQIGYVPQDDIIHRELTVAEVLTYAAQLRLPPDIDVKAVVNKTLAEIKMLGRENTLISKLSGGQRKRVSIGVELLADPKLFFLDEPTSGLDPGLDKKMMQLLRKLADQGRTIILVTHATGNITLCDRIAFLGRGGRLCYFGTPADALAFFRVTTQDFADIYNTLETDEETVERWAFQFSQSEYYQRYIGNYLSVGEPRTAHPHSPKMKPMAIWNQLKLLTQRYFQLTLRDPVNLGLNLLTAPIGISLILIALRDQDPLVGEPEATLPALALRVLFVFTCASLWVGFSSSLQEIIKETPIYHRERLVNLRLLAYLGSKIIILSGLALLQSLLITVVILIGFADPAPTIISWSLGLMITTFLTLLSCMSLGLLVSAVVKNSSQANSALPLLLLPQIIFSGVLFNMEGFASKFSWLMLSRWSVAAYGALVDVNSMVPAPTELPDGSTVPLPFPGSNVYNATGGNLGLSWLILLVHTFVYLGVTLMWQKRKDIL